MSQHTEDSKAYRRMRLDFLADHRACWICHHDGADTIDHDPPRAVHRVDLDVSTWRPAHGVAGCPTCKRRCNQERGVKAHVNVFAPKIEW